jgi:hypothetical protein
MPAVGSILEVSVAVWTNQGTLGQYPIQRRYQWYLDGVAIPGAVGLSHTPEVAGTYTVTETAFYLSRSPTGGFLESSSTTVTSAPMVVTSTLDPNLVYLKDLNWLGCFRLPNVSYIQGQDWRDFALGVTSLAYSPTGNGGLGSMYSTAHSGYGVGEFTIPAPSKTAAQFATLLTLPTVKQDPSEGQFGTSGMTSGVGFSTGIHVSNGRLIITYHGNYTYSQSDWFWTRPLDLNATGDVRGPYSIRGAYGERWHAGYICDVPPELQTKLGGPLLCGCSADSIQSATSDGPPIGAFNPDAFTTKTGLRGTFGAITGNTFVVTGGSDADNYYTNWRLALQTITGSATEQPLTVTAYNGTTKVITVSNLSTWVSAGVNASMTFVLVPYIPATDLAMYGLFELQNYKPYGKYCGIWTETSSKIGDGVAINGTRSVLLFGIAGNGMTQYAIPSGGSYDAGEISSEGFRVYDPEGGARGEHTYPYTPRIWAYDANDLEQARLGNVLPKDVKPYGVFDFKFPTYPGSTRFTGGATYDPKTRRLYVGANSNGYGFSIYGERVIHVYEVTNAVAVP